MSVLVYTDAVFTFIFFLSPELGSEDQLCKVAHVITMEVLQQVGSTFFFFSD